MVIMKIKSILRSQISGKPPKFVASMRGTKILRKIQYLLPPPHGPSWKGLARDFVDNVGGHEFASYLQGWQFTKGVVHEDISTLYFIM
jgi:hypothetical protein